MLSGSDNKVTEPIKKIGKRALASLQHVVLSIKREYFFPVELQAEFFIDELFQSNYKPRNSYGASPIEDLKQVVHPFKSSQIRKCSRWDELLNISGTEWDIFYLNKELPIKKMHYCWQPYLIPKIQQND